MFNKLFGPKEARVSGVDERMTELDILIKNGAEFEHEVRAEHIDELSDLLNVKIQAKDLEIADKGMGIDKNVVINGMFGLAAILMIVEREKTDVITTKALNIGQRMIGR